MIVGFFETYIVAYLLLFVAGSSVAMGMYVYRREQHKKSVVSYAAISFSIGLWVAMRALLQFAEAEGFTKLFAYLTFIPPVFVTLFLLLFSVYIGKEETRIPLKYKILIFVPWGVLLMSALIPGLVVSDVHPLPNGVNEVVYGSYFRFIYAPLIALFLLSVFPVLALKYKRVSFMTQLQLRYILLGMLLSIGVAIVANVILPLFGLTDFVWMGPLSAFILVAIIGYALSRKKLWDFKLILSELLVALILIVQFAEIFLASQEPGRALFQGVIFALTALFSIFLVKGIFKEIESKENVSALAEDLAAANQRLQEIDAEKSDFVSIATHQLRTPLTVIKGYSSMLLEGSFGPIEDENKRGVIQKMFEASQRLVMMIEDFLDIPRIEGGKMSYFFEKVSVSEFLDEVVSELKRTLKEGDYNITSFSEPELYIIADKLKLRQVITNLLDNAMKYSPRGTSIHLAAKDARGKVLLTIKDSGAGIPKEVMPRLFKKFSRGNAFAKLQTEGRGLGLFIAKQIMTAHGGKVWLESEGRNMGTTACLEFQQFIPSEKRQEIKEFVKEVGLS